MTEINRVRELAGKATPGPWRMEVPDRGYRHDYVLTDDPSRAPTKEHPWRHFVCDCDSGEDSEDAAYIAAANPAFVTALLDRLERAEKALRPFAEFAQAALNDIPYHEQLPAKQQLYSKLLTMDGGPRGRPTYAHLTAGDFREAIAALARFTSPGEPGLGSQAAKVDGSTDGPR